MATLVYTPGVRAVIDTDTYGPIDVTEDIVSGQVRRVEDGVSSVNFTLANHNRKYDNIFTPNDRIAVQLKRIRWLQVFVGYLNTVPMFSAWPRSVDISASCSLKRTQFFPWDPYASASIELLNSVKASGQDGGMRKRAELILTEVVGWERNRIHIGEVPSKWLEQIESLYGIVAESLANHDHSILGGSASISGSGALERGVLGAIQGTSTKAGVSGNPATGVIPATRGAISWFGGPNDPSMSQKGMALSGEPGIRPRDEWYCAMRWPYVQSLPYRKRRSQPRPDLTAAQVGAAKQWWNGQRILVVNQRAGAGVVLRAADWGPAEWTDKTIDVSRTALQVLGADTGDMVDIAFAPEGAPLGPITLPGKVADLLDRTRAAVGSAFGVSEQTGSAGGTQETRSQPSSQVPFPVPSGITGVSSGDMGWGGYSNGQIPLTAMSKFTSGSTSEDAGRYLHPIAANAWQALLSDAARSGFGASALHGSGYRSLQRQRQVAGPRAATPGRSNHGWGLALDIGRLFAPAGAATTAKYDDPLYRWLSQNASRYGWVNPPWAQRGGSLPEPWHWEFWGIFNFVPKGGGGVIPTGTPVRGGGSGASSSVGGSGGLGGGSSNGALFNAAYWSQQASPESEILAGPRALMNDEPVMNTLRVLMGAAARNWCSAPNGDFIGWFPDYFGAYGTASRLKLHTIEVLDFTINWGDERLKTHQYVTGAIHGETVGSGPGGAQAAYAKWITHGVASVEYPEVLTSLFNIERDTIFSDPQRLLRRFGARIDHQTIPTIVGREAEFWYALHLFQRNWAEQFSTQVPVTFMPEAWPGMLMEIPELNFQAYIREVVHSFGFADGQGFSTSLSITAPSALDSGGTLLGLPKAGPRPPVRQEEVGDL